MAEEQVPLKLLVDTQKNRVVSAEAGKDFMDTLLSFLTLPLGTIARIVSTDSNLEPIRVGSLNSLYGSVANLEAKHFWTELCKEMLRQPRNSMESHQNLKLNIDDSEPMKYFICENWDCSRRKSGGLLSTFKNTRCSCGRVMNREIGLHESLQGKTIHEGYANELASFTLSDDLKVMPSNLDSSIVVFLKNLGIEDMDSIEEIILNVDRKKVVDLLKCSFLSKSPLTGLFLRKRVVQEDFEQDGLLPSELEIPEASTLAFAPAENSKQMKVKVMLRKSKSKVLFVQAEEDFADFILSFLTLPLGAVLNMLDGNSGIISLDNLFKSLADLHASKHLMSEKIKNLLFKPQVAGQFNLQNQMLPIDEANLPNYSCYSSCMQSSDRTGFLTSAREYSWVNYEVYAPLTPWNPRSSNGDTSSPGGFARGPSIYMVTDDLVVTPFSSISVASFLNKSKIPFHDLEERVISIGLEEALSILKASLVSSSALTKGLTPFLEKMKCEEKSRK